MIKGKKLDEEVRKEGGWENRGENGGIERKGEGQGDGGWRLVRKWEEKQEVARQQGWRTCGWWKRWRKARQEIQEWRTESFKEMWPDLQI